MLHAFKIGGRRFAYDSASDTLHSLDEIAYKMLDYLELPMPKDCPSALRYDLAKYDSAAIGETYAMLYALYQDGKFCAPDEDFTPVTPECSCGGAILRFADGTECHHENPHLLAHAAAMTGDIGLEIVAQDENALTADDLPELLKEITKLAKDLHKNGSEKSAFKPVAPFVHTFAVCKDCWARKLCSLKCPSPVACDLERSRAECELSLGK